eukprot:c31786_g1_i1 orf=1-153(-)
MRTPPLNKQRLISWHCKFCSSFKLDIMSLTICDYWDFLMLQMTIHHNPQCV